MNRDVARQKLLAFLDTVRRPEAALPLVEDSAPLVSSGVLDSLTLLEIISFLELDFGIDFSESGVDPEELASIGAILDLIERRV